MHVGGFGIGTQILGLAIAVCFAHGVTTGGQGHGLFVVHGHASKRHTHIVCRAQRIGFATHAFGVHIDQTHLHSGQGVFERFAVVARTFIAGRCQPLFFRTPINVELGVPNVFATKRVTVGFQTHGLISHVTRQDHQVGPRQLVAVFFLDGPQQATGLVKVGVVGP